MCITDNKNKSRYEMNVQDALAIADYTLRGRQLMITHVEVPTALRGHGVAAKLMEFIVDDSKARQLHIIPICSYAAAYLHHHPVK